MVSHLVRDVDRWVHCVKLNVEFIQIELLSFVLDFLDSVAILILRILLVHVLFGVFVFFLFVFL